MKSNFICCKRTCQGNTVSQNTKIKYNGSVYKAPNTSGWKVSIISYLEFKKKKKPQHVAFLSYVVVVPLLSHVQLFATSWTTAYQASLSFSFSRSLLKLMSIEFVMLSKHLILCCPLSSILTSPNNKLFWG